MEPRVIRNYNYRVSRVVISYQPEKWYNAVVIAGFGEDPMILVTNRQLNTRESKAIYRIVEIYLIRLKCEECYRYYMGHIVKLKIIVQKTYILSKRFFDIPTFFNHAMADGIAELLKKDNIAQLTFRLMLYS